MRTQHRPKWISGVVGLALLIGAVGPASAARDVKVLQLVGSLQFGVQRAAGLHVSAYENLAFVTPGTATIAGARIVDISNPSAPVLLATTTVYPATTPSVAEATRIGERDVLAVGHLSGSSAGHRGLDLLDISDPASPTLLSFFPAPPPTLPGLPSSGVADVDIFSAPGGRTLAILAVEFYEQLSRQAGMDGQGDVLILDITNPEQPFLVGEWGIMDEPTIGGLVLQGSFPFSTAVDVHVDSSGKRAFVAYFDAGTIILDISDPAKPSLLGRVAFDPTAEGNAQSTGSIGGNVLVETIWDTFPYLTTVTSSVLPGPTTVTEAAMTLTPRVATLPGRSLTGEVIDVGRGCPAGTVSPGSPADPYPPNVPGKIVLVTRAVGCPFAASIARAQLEGAIGFILYNQASHGEGVIGMAGSSPVTLPDGTVVTITIPAMNIGYAAGLALQTAPAPTTVRIESTFNGWGGVRVISVKDPAAPQLLTTFDIPESTDPDLALTGSYALGVGDVRGNRAYLAWGNAGVRVVDLAQPSSPREIMSWTGEGRPAGAARVNITGVSLHRDLILVNDSNYGFYILQAP